MLCPPQLTTSWDAVCLTADLDGDTRTDAAYLVPLPSRGAPAPFPGVVLVRRGSDFKFLRFADADADTSTIGRSMFTAADRTGDGRPDLSYLTTTCNATGCSTDVHVQSWDGTAWREAGPADGGIENVDAARFDAGASGAELVLHGGPLASPGSGPTRAATFTYAFAGTRFSPVSVVPEPAVYLFHAVLDADAKFDAGDFPGAISAYQGAIANMALKDWKQETGAGNGRAFLVPYALFRIALATAAKGDDPNAAIDAVITGSDGKDPIFAYAAQKFREGLQSHGSVHGGCIDVTQYLALKAPDGGDNAMHIRDGFFYGHANPAKTYESVCPL